MVASEERPGSIGLCLFLSPELIWLDGAVAS